MRFSAPPEHKGSSFWSLLRFWWGREGLNHICVNGGRLFTLALFMFWVTTLCWLESRPVYVSCMHVWFPKYLKAFLSFGKQPSSQLWNIFLLPSHPYVYTETDEMLWELFMWTSKFQYFIYNCLEKIRIHFCGCVVLHHRLREIICSDKVVVTYGI